MTIKELRKENNMTQKEFAKSIDVHPQSVAAYERGVTKPSQKVLDKIEEVYGVTVDMTVSVEKKTKEQAVKVGNSAKKGAKKIKEQAVAVADDAKKMAKKTAKSAKTGGKKLAETAARGVGAAKKTKVVIQSPLGGEITPDEILQKIGNVDEVYIRVDENKAYWVKGKESGSVDLW